MASVCVYVCGGNLVSTVGHSGDDEMPDEVAIEPVAGHVDSNCVDHKVSWVGALRQGRLFFVGEHFGGALRRSE